MPDPIHIVLQNDRGFAKTVLMPGDPLRSKFIAENFLTDAVLVNNNRYAQSYTGTWKGKPVSVTASGMGMPSMGLYAWELYNCLDVENIIRIGTTGGIARDLKLFDIVMAEGACTNSNYAAQFGLPGTFAPIADFGLMQKCWETAQKRGQKLVVGNVLSSDMFYDDANSGMDWDKMGVKAVEMEAAALYMLAARAHKKALAIFTVSDLIFDLSQSLTAEQCERSVSDMIELALDTAAEL